MALKFNALSENLAGRRVVMIDDSLVRGTTAGPLVKLIRDAGATEVHVRITCPPIMHPCHFGVDMGHDGDLMAARLTLEEIRERVGADSLEFLSLEGMMRAVGNDDGAETGYCNACFTGRYPLEVAEAQAKLSFEGVAARCDAGRGRSAAAGAGAGDRLGVPAPRSRRRRVARRPSTAVDLDAVDLVIPGPEAALVAGVADRCAAAGVPCFGPTAALAELEASKGFARELAASLGIPGPAFARFAADEVDAARRRGGASSGGRSSSSSTGWPAARASRCPADEAATEAAIRAADGPFVLEERMTGPECSLLALCDGRTARALPLAQDHKRIGEGDTGPNTGGMGAYAPAPVPYAADELLGDVRPAGARPLRRRRHAVRRRALRRADADRRRAPPRRVQRPLRRPRGAGRAPAAGVRPRRAGPGRDPRRARRPSPSRSPPAPPAPSSPPPPATPTAPVLGGHIRF